MKYSKICTFSNVAMILIPVSALSGWIFDVEFLKTLLHPSGIGMNPMSGICFLFLGSAYFCVTRFPRNNMHLILASFPFFIGLMQVGEYLLSYNVHLDQVLFTGRLKGNIMAPNAAGAFVLASLAVLTFRAKTFRGFAIPSIFSLAVAWMALLAFTGYLYGVNALYGVTEYIPMALNTAVTFSCFTLGILFAKADNEPARTFLSKTKGGRVARILIPPAMLFPILSAWVRLQGDAANLWEPMFGVTFFVLVNVFVWGVALWITSHWIYKIDMKNEELVDLLARKAKLDPLTGLWNRRYLEERLDAAYATLERHGRPFSCIITDIDFFKKVNDNFGHPFGDLVIKKFGDILVNTARREDVVCRIGGEEFVILLPDTDIAKAAQLAERLRAAVERTPMENDEVSMKITCSLGVAQASARHEPVVDVADAQLYKAKQTGRNRVVAKEYTSSKAA